MKLLRERKKELVGCISAEEESIQLVEEELAEEREKLKSERNAFQERQDKLSSQQVGIICRGEGVCHCSADSRVWFKNAARLCKPWRRSKTTKDDPWRL